MAEPAAFRACYSDWKLIRTRKCVQLVFEVPLEESNKAYEALGGMPNPGEESWVAIARLNPEAAKEVMPDRRPPEHNNTSPASEPDKVQARAPRNKLAQLAGMLSKDPLFPRYLAATEFYYGTDDPTIAIRGFCSVDSRSQIIVGTPAGDRFLKLYDDFICWRDADIYVEASA
jgi:hypothetical protein